MLDRYCCYYMAWALPARSGAGSSTLSVTVGPGRYSSPTCRAMAVPADWIGTASAAWLPGLPAHSNPAGRWSCSGTPSEACSASPWAADGSACRSRRVCGLGVKVRWATAELAKAAALAARPATTFATRAEAMDRALRVAGLHGLTPELPSAIADAPAGWQLTLDNAAFGVGAPDLAGLLAACRAKVVLAAGQHDPMCPAEHLAEFGAPVLLAGCGHNAHVEKPAALRPLLDQLLQAFLAINVQ